MSRTKKTSLEISWKNWLISISTGFILAASAYFWFLQVDTVISKSRLAMGMGLGMLLGAGIYWLLKNDILKLQSTTKDARILAIDLSLILSLLLCLMVIGVERAPLNLLTLPKVDLAVEVIVEDDPEKTVELVSFHNGLSTISFAAFEMQGEWQRTEDSLKASVNQPASLHYHGWLTGTPTFIFKSGPASGRVKIHWGDDLAVVRLDLPASGETELYKQFTPPASNRYSTLLVTWLALAILLFPFLLQLARLLEEKRRMISLDDWFDQIKVNIQGWVAAALVISLLASLLLMVSPAFHQDDVAAILPDQVSADSPNVILVVIDSLSAEDMSLFGYDLPTTPNLERIAQEWTVYTNAQTSMTCSIGAYPTLMTGRYPIYLFPFSQYGDAIHASSDWVNLTAILSRAGYRNWWYHWYGRMSPGFYHSGQGVDAKLFDSATSFLSSAWFQMGGVMHNTFPYFPLSLSGLTSLVECETCPDQLDQLGEMMTAGRFQPPFFLFIQYGGTHGIPYPPGDQLGTFLPIEDGLIDLDSQARIYGPYPPERQAQVDLLRLRYDESVLDQDNNLNKLIENIKQAGLYDSSLIILMSDHGDVFSQDGYSSHCTPLLSQAEAHIPLLIKYPHQAAGDRVEALVSSVDVTPTILDALGIVYQPDWFEGYSLLSTNVDVLNGRFIFTRNSYAVPGLNYFAVMDEQYRLVLRGKEYFLFNYQNDPQETKNLINAGTLNPLRLEQLKRALAEFQQRAQ